MSIKDTAKLASLKNTEQRIEAISQRQELTQSGLTVVTYQGHDPETGTAKFSKSGDCCESCSTITGGDVISTGAIAIGESVLARPTEGKMRIDRQPITANPSECGSAGAPSSRDFGGGATGGTIITESFVCPAGQVKSGSYRIEGTNEVYEVYTGVKKTGVPIDGFPKTISQLCETETITTPIPPENFPIFKEGDALENIGYCGEFPNVLSLLTWSSGSAESNNPPIQYDLVANAGDGVVIEWFEGITDTVAGGTTWEIWDTSYWTGLIQLDLRSTANDSLLGSDPNYGVNGQGVPIESAVFFLDGATFDYVSVNPVTDTFVQNNLFFTPSGTRQSSNKFGSYGSKPYYFNTEAGYHTPGGELNYNASIYFEVSNFRYTTYRRYEVKVYHPDTNSYTYHQRLTAAVPTVSLDVSSWDLTVTDATGEILAETYETEPTNFRYSCRSKSPR